MACLCNLGRVLACLVLDVVTELVQKDTLIRDFSWRVLF